MACYLWMRGRTWDVQDFVERAGIVPTNVTVRGDVMRGYRAKVSSLSFLIGPQEFTRLPRQVAAAVKFLERPVNARWLRRAAREPDVERVITFGIPMEEAAVVCHYLPDRLVALACRHHFALAVDQYPVSVPRRPATPRRAARTRP